MCEFAFVLANSFANVIPGKHRTEWLITSAKPFCQGHHVRHHIFLLAGKKSACSPTATHHFISNKQDIMLIADSTNFLEVAAHCSGSTQCRTDHRFCDKCCDVVCTRGKYRRFQLRGHALAIVSGRLALELVPVRVARRNAWPVMQYFFKCCAP